LYLKVVFDVDLENDDLEDKLRQLKDLENAMLVQLRESKLVLMRKEGETWLRAQPDKPF
jgi:hypothetical protein